MNPTKLPSKRKALKELFRSNKRAHTSGDDSSSSNYVLNARAAAGSSELVPPFEGSEVVSNQHNGSSYSDADIDDAMTASGSLASVPITTAPAQPGDVPSVLETRSVASAAEMAWSAFKAALPILEKVSVVFPPLQSAVGGLIKVVAQFDVSCDTHGRECLMNTDHTSNPDL